MLQKDETTALGHPPLGLFGHLLCGHHVALEGLGLQSLPWDLGASLSPSLSFPCTCGLSLQNILLLFLLLDFPSFRNLLSTSSAAVPGCPACKCRLGLHLHPPVSHLITRVCVCFRPVAAVGPYRQMKLGKESALPSPGTCCPHFLSGLPSESWAPACGVSHLTLHLFCLKLSAAHCPTPGPSYPSIGTAVCFWLFSGRKWPGLICCPRYSAGRSGQWLVGCL